MGGPGAAMALWLQYALGKLPSGTTTPRWRAANPEACNQSALFVLRELQGNGISNEEFEEFARTMLSRHRLLTYAVAENAFVEWQRPKKHSVMSLNQAVEHLSSAQPSQNYDDMSDEEVAEAYRRAQIAAAWARR